MIRNCLNKFIVPKLSIAGIDEESLLIGSPQMRVEIFTLARGARAHIESTQFIIMTYYVIIIN
jgi:hypothetical protein